MQSVQFGQKDAITHWLIQDQEHKIFSPLFPSCRSHLALHSPMHDCDLTYAQYLDVRPPLTLSPESGYRWTPLGTSSAIFAAAALRMVSTKTRQESSSFFRQLLGHPSTIVLGFRPPKPAVCILQNMSNGHCLTENC